MNTLIYTILILFVAVVIVQIIKIKFRKDKSGFPYRKKDYLLSVAEKEFYQVLSTIAVKNNYLLFAKVRLEDLLWIPKHTSNRFGLRNRVKSRHVDFLLCDKNNIKPILVIELDDSSHNMENGIKRDKFVNQVLHDAELPILHQKVQQSYNPQELEDKISQLLA